jgi:hypothetical protein
VSEPAAVQAAEERYGAELAKRAVADVRPACRYLLRQLKATAPEAYETGVRRYEDELVPSIADGSANPLDEWISYGGWLCDQLYDGRLVCVDASGRSTPLEGPLPAGAMALYLPGRDDQATILLAAPESLSHHQTATRDLLCR